MSVFLFDSSSGLKTEQNYDRQKSFSFFRFYWGVFEAEFVSFSHYTKHVCSYMELYNILYILCMFLGWQSRQEKAASEVTCK